MGQVLAGCGQRLRQGLTLAAATLLGFAAPLGAQALDPALAVAVTTCVAEGQGLAQRADSLAAQGWRVLGPTMRAEAVLALAHVEPAIKLDLDSADPERRSAAWERSRRNLDRISTFPSDDAVWLDLPGEGAFVLAETLDDRMLRCIVVGPLTPEGVGAALGVATERFAAREMFTFDTFVTVPDIVQRPGLITLVAGALPGLDPAPLFYAYPTGADAP